MIELGRRELQCLQWIAAGKNTPEIAIILDLAPSTVRWYVKQLMMKLHVTTRAQAVCKIMATELQSQEIMNRIPWPDPTPKDLRTPEFNAVWDCIKKWDIAVPNAYCGYCGATGNHVMAILNALKGLKL